MDTNLIATLGLLVVVLAIPASLRRWADDRFPFVPLLSLLIGLGVLGWLIYFDPGGFSIQDIPNAVVEVVSRIL